MTRFFSTRQDLCFLNVITVSLAKLKEECNCITILIYMLIFILDGQVFKNAEYLCEVKIEHLLCTIQSYRSSCFLILSKSYVDHLLKYSLFFCSILHIVFDGVLFCIQDCQRFFAGFFCRTSGRNHLRQMQQGRFREEDFDIVFSQL